MFFVIKSEVLTDFELKKALINVKNRGVLSIKQYL